MNMMSTIVKMLDEKGFDKFTINMFLHAGMDLLSESDLDIGRTLNVWNEIEVIECYHKYILIII